MSTQSSTAVDVSELEKSIMAVTFSTEDSGSSQEAGSRTVGQGNRQQPQQKSPSSVIGVLSANDPVYTGTPKSMRSRAGTEGTESGEATHENGSEKGTRKDNDTLLAKKAAAAAVAAMGPSPTEEPIGQDDCSLFVGDLARGLMDEELERAFSAFGKVVNVSIKRDRATGKNLGYGFVKMSTPQEAREAKLRMHDSDLHGRRVRIGWAQKNTSLFIGGLNDTVSLDKLKETFAKFGPIDEDNTLVKNGKYGFVKFKYRVHAEAARKDMNGRQVFGIQCLKVEWNNANTMHGHMPEAANNPHHRHYPGQLMPRPPPIVVHVDLEGEQAGKISEAALRKMFSRFRPFDVVLSRHNTRKEHGDGPKRVRAAVHFMPTPEGEQNAARAVESLDQTTYQHMQVTCCYGVAPPYKSSMMGMMRPMMGAPPPYMGGYMDGMAYAGYPMPYPRADWAGAPMPARAAGGQGEGRRNPRNQRGKAGAQATQTQEWQQAPPVPPYPYGYEAMPGYYSQPVEGAAPDMGAYAGGYMPSPYYPYAGYPSYAPNAMYPYGYGAPGAGYMAGYDLSMMGAGMQPGWGYPMPGGGAGAGAGGSANDYTESSSQSQEDGFDSQLNGSA